MRGAEAPSPTAHVGDNSALFSSLDDEDDLQQPHLPDRPQDRQPRGWNPGGGIDNPPGIWGSVSLPKLGLPVGGLDEAAPGRAQAHRGLGGEGNI